MAHMTVSKVPLAMSKYLTGCLDAEDGNPRLRVALELVDQLDSFGGRDAAVDADVAGLQRHNGYSRDRNEL
ncbi:hypothetical protein EYF80_058546 [Liparis tanakae]|uniref:Uncharacterized protein n=1 Tax=Liparis tanakae TaxID=230148 RepID=A0A4Z2ERS0_9TELE|nr:hypothetical protein EYF80_058546 [Liparis tanakae]